jgi:hypothetical protein
MLCIGKKGNTIQLRGFGSPKNISLHLFQNPDSLISSSFTCINKDGKTLYNIIQIATKPFFEGLIPDTSKLVRNEIYRFEKNQFKEINFTQKTIAYYPARNLAFIKQTLNNSWSIFKYTESSKEFVMKQVGLKSINMLQNTIFGGKSEYFLCKTKDEKWILVSQSTGEAVSKTYNN